MIKKHGIKNTSFKKIFIFALLIFLIFTAGFLTVSDIPAPTEKVVKVLDGKQFYDKTF